MESIPYASTVGSLMYAQVCLRLDIAYAVGMLGTYQSNPGMEHWKATKKVMRYLQRTKNHMLTYKNVDHLEMVRYSDSDFVGCKDSRKSTSRYVFMLVGGAISWKSTKQMIIALSTMEAEFIACFEATSHAKWLRNFITRLQVVDSLSKPLQIYCNNLAAIFFSKNNKSESKERIKEQEVSIEHTSTTFITADPMTKGLSIKTFLKHVESMGLVSSFYA